jgi:hypothetical protein
VRYIPKISAFGAAAPALFAACATALCALAPAQSVLTDSRGTPRFLSADPGGSLAGDLPKATKAADRAAATLRQQRPRLGGEFPGEVLSPGRIRHHGRRAIHEFDQNANGVPIYGARVLVHVDDDDRIPAIVSGLSTGLTALPAPAAPPDPAPALAALRARHPGVVVLHEPQFVVFDPALLHLPGVPFHAWCVTAQPEEDPASATTYFLDPATGDERFAHPAACTARTRRIYDASNTSVVNINPTRSEGDVATGIADVDTAYTLAGGYYDFLFSNFGRDGVNGAGGTLKLIVRFCTEAAACPYQNAYWSNAAAFFGQGFARADDVVGHELAHGMTEAESGLIYFGQPGALNEALSDIMGELFDSLTGTDDDTAATIGEDVPGLGAFRSLADPTLFDDPDTTCSEFWYDGPADGGGIHTNCGVINKFAYLLIRGGTFNGETIQPLNSTNSLNIFYKVQTEFLLPTSSFEDFHNAMLLAAADLGLGSIVANKINAAAAAVMIDAKRTCQPVPVAPANDTCAAALTITPGIPLSATTDGATGTYQSSCGPFQLNDYRDVWFRFVADSDFTIITVDADGLSFAPVLAVGEENCEDLQAIGCNYSELVLPFSPPLLQIPTTAGKPYLIRIAGRDAATGDFTLLVNVEPHTADQDGDNVLSIDELLRVIQFYNSLELHCQADSEDGYAPGPGAPGSTTCTPHASDYAPQDWSVSIDELLRAIQFYNSLGYRACEHGEDGYCPGPD